MTIESSTDRTVISGNVTVKDARSFPGWADNNSFYVTVDLSSGQFEESEEEYRRFYGMSHSGGVYGPASIKKVYALQILLECLHAGTVILPANVTKKMLNVCIKNSNIGQIIVTEDCRLFSMKDGSIWNKKGTILIHEQYGAPKFVTCEGCGSSVMESVTGKTVDGGFVCPQCFKRFITYYGEYGSYILYNGLYYHEDDPRLKELLAREGKTVSDCW